MPRSISLLLMWNFPSQIYLCQHNHNKHNVFSSVFCELLYVIFLNQSSLSISDWESMLRGNDEVLLTSSVTYTMNDNYWSKYHQTSHTCFISNITWMFQTDNCKNAFLILPLCARQLFLDLKMVEQQCPTAQNWFCKRSLLSCVLHSLLGSWSILQHISISFRSWYMRVLSSFWWPQSKMPDLTIIR